MKKVKRKIIQIDEERCDGCGQCVPACAEGTIAVIDGKARIVADNLCDGLGACLGECPNGALRIIEREAEEFDETAVEKRLAEIEKASAKAEPAAMPCGCPSTHIMEFGKARPCPESTPGKIEPAVKSELTHWPIKIRLVPPDAPFLKNADLLVLADCAATACPELHKNLLKGRVVMMGCPKFDEVQAYVDKFEQICRNGGIRSITTVIMEVPCCSGLNGIVRKGMEASGKNIPLEEIVIGRRGEVVERRKVA
ncbi:MAG: 4Fe-4S binding protein [Desulfobacterales bacterium]|jgi:NAD-dependent dihydropyrimidine dehydrogenase PreA subunit|nr:4Fe-4S binding protein [Desulfobacterales bacterium]